MDRIVLAVLAHHGVYGVDCVEVLEDRVFAYDDAGQLEAWCNEGGTTRVLNDKELPSTFRAHHPDAIACWREKDVSPALQILKLKSGQWEIDLDLYAPRLAKWYEPLGAPSLWLHKGEVLYNKITGKKTSRELLVKWLKKNRGIDVPSTSSKG